MSQPPKDQTFRNYTPSQANTYASHRPRYPAPLLDLILSHHASTGGQFQKFLDVGCGPGNATRDLAGYFEEVVGVDAGEAMIERAREMGGETGNGGVLRYVVCEGERISEVEGLVEEEGGSVDLVCVATAVHWFVMPKFYAEAAKVLKPGGTLALWTRVSFLAGGIPDPQSQHPIELTNLIHNFRHVILKPYELPGNRLAGDLYDNLPLPWDVLPSIPSLPQSHYKRYDFDRSNGGVIQVNYSKNTPIIPDEGNSKHDQNPNLSIAGRKTTTLREVERKLSTASPVTRWRGAHPELAGTEGDCVKVFLREMRGILGGEEVVDGFATTVLLFKKVG